MNRFAAFLLFFVLPVAVVCGASVVVENDDFAVQVNNEQNPKYFFWRRAEPARRWKVQFSQMLEIGANGTDVPGSRIALSSLRWEFEFPDEPEPEPEPEPESEPEVANDLPFALTGTFEENKKDPRFSSVRFEQHLAFDAAEMKFDIALLDYAWVSDDPDARLRLEWKLLDQGDGESSTAECGAGCCAGEVFFGAAGEAETGTARAVRASLGCGAKLTVTYDHFDGSLYHDPSFGYAQEATTSSSSFSARSFSSSSGASWSSSPATRLLPRW